MEIKLASTEEELHKIAPVMRQLRPEFKEAELIAQIKLQKEKGFQIAYIESDARVLCVAGFVFGEKLAWGKCIYIDDLVTAEDHRSQGAGAAMIDWFKHYAREQGCSQIHLDSGIHRVDAHRFYLREGFKQGSLHFALSDF